MTTRYIIPILLFVIAISCKETPKITNPLLSALSSNSSKIKNVMDSLDKHDVQIKFTQIDRKNDQVIFTDYDYNVNANKYFYPASTVKFPVAILALEKINSIPNFDMNTKFYIEGDTLETTVAKEISKIFAVSDNEAYNRLFEFLGQDQINSLLKAKGIANFRISHRVSAPDSDNITTKPIIVYSNDSTTRVREKIISRAIKPLVLEDIKKGVGYYEDDDIINMPFDFSLKNYYTIEAQHSVLKRVLFPENFKLKERFKITENQRKFIVNAMHTLPKELGYDENEYYDSYVKFFMFGDNHKPIPKTIEIYNKVGYAYGTLTDCAYIKDTENNIEFLITATILVNANQIFNDNIYEYDSIGIPFLAELGRIIYQQELQRKKR